MRYSKTRMAIGAAVLIFGLGCLNYTNAWQLERHNAVAEEHGVPAPSSFILRTGMALTTIGGLVLGHALGARRRAQ